MSLSFSEWQAAWLSAVSPDKDKDDDVDPLKRSLQRFEMLSHLALLDNPVDTKCITYSEDSMEALAGSSQVRSLNKSWPSPACYAPRIVIVSC